MYINENPNPNGNAAGDCVVRAISIAEDMPWKDVYMDLCMTGLDLGDMPSSNRVWGAYLKDKGYERGVVVDMCPHCYTVEEFCRDNPIGTYVLGTGTHAVAVIDGDYIDAWDSGNEVPVYYWEKRWR